MGDTDDYPHWRTALFGNGHVANLYCAIKYGLWHLFHVLFVVMGAIFIALAVPLLLAWRFIVYVGTRADAWIDARTSEGQAVDRTRVQLHRTAETVRNTPVTRRIYGECPVDIKLDPHWFSRIKGFGDSAIDKISPPTMVWVCTGCDDPFEWRTERDRPCRHCGSKHVRVREDRIEERHEKSGAE